MLARRPFQIPWDSVDYPARPVNCPYSGTAQPCQSRNPGLRQSTERVEPDLSPSAGLAGAGHFRGGERRGQSIQTEALANLITRGINHCKRFLAHPHDAFLGLLAEFFTQLLERFESMRSILLSGA